MAHGEMVSIHIDRRTLDWLRRFAEESGLPVEDLAERAVESYVLDAVKARGWPVDEGG